MREFNLFLQSSDQHQELYQKLSQELEKPTLEQVESWELVANPVYELVETMRNQDGPVVGFCLVPSPELLAPCCLFRSGTLMKAR